MKSDWSHWPRHRKVLTAAALGGGVMCVLAFVPSPMSLLSVFARVDAPAIKAPPAIAIKSPLPLEHFASIAERPLFNVDRKPDPVPPPPAAAKPTVTLGDLAQLRLVGIVRSKQTQLALVRRADNKVLTLRTGDTLDGWTVETIDSDGVGLSGADRQDRLKIPKAENSAPPSSPPPTPGN